MENNFDPNNEMLFETGLLTQVEDAGYPMVGLYFDFPERDFSEYFSLNLEENHSVDINILEASIDRYVHFGYTSVLENELVDLMLEDTSLLDEPMNVGDDVELYSITGILSNAEEVTSSDLPGEFYIQTEEEITEVFPYYITERIAEANGSSVVAIYVQRTVNTIHSFEVQ
jgi:hypothetical protein